MAQETIRNLLSESISTKENVKELMTEDIARVVDLITGSFKHKGQVLFCGNGGSAADAQHLAAEFVSRFLINRDGLPALALHTNTSTMTAIGNDFGYGETYARLVQAFGRPGDVLVALSTSGNSENVVRAVETAQKMGLVTVAMTGQGGGQLAGLVDILLAVPSLSTPRIQEAHITIGHIICEVVESELFGKEEGVCV